jgi:acyl-CoA synthetase (AMP-forming)/AMP-acid ligase II
MTENSLAAIPSFMGVDYLIRRAAQEYRDRTAVIIPGERKVSFGELDERSKRLAAGLLSLGLKKEDPVAVLLPNSQEYLEVYLGLARAGLVRVSLNVRLSPGEHTFMLEDSESRALIVAAELFEGLRQAIKNLPKLRWTILVEGSEKESLEYEKLIGDAPSPAREPEIDVQGVFRLHYTSGTTGRPKGAIQTHASRVTTTFNTLMDVVNFNPNDRVLHVAPLTHASGNLFLPSFIRGGANIPLRRFDPALFCRTVEEEGITCVFLAPTMVIRLLAFPDLERYDLGRLHTIIYGGAPMPAEPLKQALRRMGPRLVQIYGLAEATWADTVLTREDHDPGREDRLGSIGRELRNMRIRLVDERGKEVSSGEMGELIIQGPHLMREYWKQPEATRAALRDGWFYTGDLARADREGYITLLDRKGEMIVSGGFNVYPKEVEDTLYLHPGVLEAAVFGVPDPEWGEAVKAVIFPKQGWTLSEEEIIQHCRNHLASYKKPRSVEFFPEPLPKNSAGKILRRALREKYWAGYRRRIN